MIEPHDPPLPAHAIDRIAACLGPARELGAVTRLPLKPMVADYCEKFVALDTAGRPAAFIVISPGSHPSAVFDAVEATKKAAQALSTTLADALLLPYFVGEIDGRSYSITAYCRPMSTGRLRGRWQRKRLRPAALAWLAQLTRHSARTISTLDADVRAPLESLANHAAVGEETRRAATAALGALGDGSWVPRSVLAHNDLWWGNFVHRDEGNHHEPPFHVIDWAGSDLRGAPFYDLVRLADSLGMGAHGFGRELRAHCVILDCTPESSLHYLSLAMGRLSLNLGEWPAAQFASTARACLRYASAALE